MLTELKMALHDWTSVINIVPSVPNKAPVERLGINKDGTKQTLLEVMTGIRHRCALLQVIGEDTRPSAPRTRQRTIGERVFKIVLLATCVHEMHKDVKERVNGRRQRAIEAHNKATMFLSFFAFTSVTL